MNLKTSSLLSPLARTLGPEARARDRWGPSPTRGTEAFHIAWLRGPVVAPHGKGPVSPRRPIRGDGPGWPEEASAPKARGSSG